MSDKKGKKLKLKLIKKRFLLNYPQKIILYPIIRKIFPYTMLSYTAICEMYDYIKEVSDKEIEGDIVEMGCWNGGCGAFMAWCVNKVNFSKTIWLFDSFEGLPELSHEDSEWADKQKQLKIKDDKSSEIKSTGFMVANEANVREALKKMGAEKNVHVVKGWFQESIPEVKHRIQKISILRLDGDLYESTLYCLEELYDMVVVGGYVVIDDYHLEGCRRALYEFFYKRNINPLIINNQFGGRSYFRKNK